MKSRFHKLQRGLLFYTGLSYFSLFLHIRYNTVSMIPATLKPAAIKNACV